MRHVSRVDEAGVNRNMAHTDLKLLQILLSLPMGKLSGPEKRAFQAMYDNLVNGKVVNLTKKQRWWLEDVYRKHDLHKKPLPRLKRIATKDKKQGRP